MEKEKLKMLQVREETHEKVKLEALKLKMSIKDFIDYLLSKVNGIQK